MTVEEFVLTVYLTVSTLAGYIVFRKIRNITDEGR